MSLFSDVKDAVRNVTLTALSEFTNPIVIHSYGNGLEPAESYVAINILSIEQQGHHSTSSRLDTSFRQSTQVAYEALVQVTFIGSKAGDMVQSFTQRINNNYKVFEAITRNKLGVMRKSQVRNTPQRRDTKWVDYYNIDVTFSYIGLTQDVVDIVEAAVVQDVTANTIFRVPEGPIPV